MKFRKKAVKRLSKRERKVGEVIEREIKSPVV